MHPTFRKWIETHVRDSGYGRCAEVSKAMQLAFPQLTRVRGHYVCPIWGLREHWWLLDGETIVDPTAAQFPSKGTGVYIPLTGDEEEPTGLCMNCGEYCYSGAYTCSDRCARECEDYYGCLRAKV